MIERAIEGQEISRICVDFAVWLYTADGVEVCIETAFAVEASAGAGLVVVRQDDLRTAGGDVLALLGQQITKAKIHHSGRLDLTFSRGGRIVCNPDEEFEAWVLAAPSGERVICSPGGGTVHWPGVR